jgi:hypothetical protein
MLLDITSYPIKLFAWVKPDKLVAEASTLGFPVGKFPFQRLYDDACDVGIRIQGNKDVRFLFVEEDVNDYDQELKCWKFVPIGDAGPIKELIIFND